MPEAESAAPRQKALAPRMKKETLAIPLPNPSTKDRNLCTARRTVKDWLQRWARRITRQRNAIRARMLSSQSCPSQQKFSEAQDRSVHSMTTITIPRHETMSRPSRAEAYDTSASRPTCVRIQTWMCLNAPPLNSDPTPAPQPAGEKPQTLPTGAPLQHFLLEWESRNE